MWYDIKISYNNNLKPYSGVRNSVETFRMLDKDELIKKVTEFVNMREQNQISFLKIEIE